MEAVPLATPEQEPPDLGLWEVAVSTGGEADLHQHYDTCPKNPGHVNFIPVDQFSVDNLPPNYHDNDVADMVRAMAELTVRVAVKYTSEDRPETFPGSKKPYPFSKYRGQKTLRTGTGWVDNIEISSEDGLFRECLCNECRKSSTPRKQFANILIKTAAHVVYDDLEGAHTTCHLFFDKGGMPKSSNGVITLNSMYRVRSNTSIDFTELVYVTHDIDFARRLKETKAIWRDLRESINKKYPGSCDEEMDDAEEGEAHYQNTLSIIVSHPHGCSKQVSIGEWSVKQNKKNEEKGWCKYLYNTPTCPGSSGAHVFLMGREKTSWWVTFIHWGISHDRLDLNECSFHHEGQFLT